MNLTHGHYDHIGGVNSLLDRFANSKVYIYYPDFEYLSNTELNLSKHLGVNVTVGMLEKLTGKPMLDYLKDTVLREIGFSENSYMLKDPFGTSMGGSGLMATPEDFLRFGMLLMNRGQIDGKQLISRGTGACRKRILRTGKGKGTFGRRRKNQGSGHGTAAGTLPDGNQLSE